MRHDVKHLLTVLRYALCVSNEDSDNKLKVIGVEPADGGQRTRITFSASPEQVEQVKALLESGEFARLGITDVSITPEADSAEEKWSSTERQKARRDQPRNTNER
jgi:hypothetical protein